MTLWAQSRRARGVRSTARSRAGRGAEGGSRHEVGNKSELSREQRPCARGGEPVQELVLGDQPLLARVLGNARHQQRASRDCAGCGPTRGSAPRASSRGSSPRACRAPRRRRRCGASRPRSGRRRSCRPGRGWRCPPPAPPRRPAFARAAPRAFPSDGSMPATSYPLAASRAASVPVPQPTSSARPPGQCACTKASRFCR